MANTAKDYKICCALFNAYIAKVSKRNPNVMLNDRRQITTSEILTLIAWILDKYVTDHEGCEGFAFKDSDGNKIELHYIREQGKEDAE